MRQACNDKKENEARLRAHAASASQQGNEYKATIVELCGRMNTGEEFVQAQNESLARAQVIHDSMRMKLDPREEEWSVEHNRVIYDMRQQAIRAIQTAEMHAETKARKAEEYVEFQKAEAMKREAAEEQRWSRLCSELSAAQASLQNQVVITNGDHDDIMERLQGLEVELSRSEQSFHAVSTQKQLWREIMRS